MTVAALHLGGVGSTPIIIYPMIILRAGWMVSVRAAVVTASLTLAATLGMVFVEGHGWLPVPPATLPLMRWFVQGCTFVLTAFLIISFVRAYRERQAELLSRVNASRSTGRRVTASPAARCRRAMLRSEAAWQILHNLIGNALRHRRRSGDRQTADRSTWRQHPRRGATGLRRDLPFSCLKGPLRIR